MAGARQSPNFLAGPEASGSPAARLLRLHQLDRLQPSVGVGQVALDPWLVNHHLAVAVRGHCGPAKNVVVQPVG